MAREKRAARRQALRRKWVQLFSALVYNANLPGFVTGRLYQGPTKGICLPGLNCYSCPGAVGACPIGSLQSSLGALPRKLPFYVLGCLLLFGLTLGRTVCGFLCPFGLLQELLYKIPSPKLGKSRLTRTLSRGKYLVLALTVLIPLFTALGGDVVTPVFCKYLCPAGTVEGGLPLAALRPQYRALLGPLFTWKALVCLVILALCVFLFRAFCRFLCPLGALYSLFNRVALVGVRVDRGKCTSCGACVKGCKLDVRRVGDRECVQCGACRSLCPHQAISLGKRPLKPTCVPPTAAPEE